MTSHVTEISRADLHLSWESGGKHHRLSSILSPWFQACFKHPVTLLCHELAQYIPIQQHPQKSFQSWSILSDAIRNSGSQHRPRKSSDFLGANPGSGMLCPGKGPNNAAVSRKWSMGIGESKEIRENWSPINLGFDATKPKSPDLQWWIWFGAQSPCPACGPPGRFAQKIHDRSWNVGDLQPHQGYSISPSR